MQATGESGGRRSTPRDSEVASQRRQRKRTRNRPTPREAAVAAQAREQAGREKAQRLTAGATQRAGYTRDEPRYRASHALPADPAARAAMLERIKRYRAVTGKNLLRQPSMGQAYADAGLEWDSAWGATGAFPSSRPWRNRDVAAREDRRLAADTGSTPDETQYAVPSTVSTAFGVISTGPPPDAQFTPTHGNDTPWWRQAGSPIAKMAGGATASIARDLGDYMPVWAAREIASKAGIVDAPTSEPVAPTFGQTIGSQRALNQAVTAGLATGAKMARGIRDAPFDIDPDRLAIAEAYASGDPELTKQYEDALKNGSDGRIWTDAERARLVLAANDRGWKDNEAQNDLELYRRATRGSYHGFEGVVRRTAAGAQDDLSAMIALGPGMRAAADSAAPLAHGDARPLGQFAWDTAIQPYVDLVEHPTDTLQDHPVNSATMIWGGLKGGGGAAARLPGVRRMFAPGRRVITPRLAAGVDAAPIDLGPKARNALIRPGQVMRERYIEGRNPITNKPVSHPWLTGVDAAGNKVRVRGREVGARAAQDRLVKREFTEAMTRAELGASNEVSRTPEVWRANIVRSQIPAKVRTVIVDATNYGRSWREMVEEHRRLAGDAMRKSDQDTANRQEALARFWEDAGPQYDTWMEQSHVYVAPGTRTPRLVKGSEIEAQYRAALNDLHALGDEAFTAFTGREGRDMREQVATRHGGQIAADLGDERVRLSAENAALAEERAKARKPVLDDARRMEREATTIERQALRDSVAEKDGKVAAARAKVIEAGRAMRKATRAHEVEVGRQARAAHNPRSLAHISVDGDGTPRGARQVKTSIAEKEAGVDSRYVLRPGIEVERFATEGARRRTDTRGHEGAIRGYNLNYRLRVGNDRLVLETMGDDGEFAPAEFNTMREAVAFARRLDGVNMRRPWSRIADERVQRVITGDDEAATLTRRARELDPLTDAEELAKIRARLGDLETGATDKTRRAMNAAIDAHAAALTELSGAMHGARPNLAWQDVARAAKLAGDAKALRDLTAGRLPKEPIEARPDALPAEAAYVEAANRVIEHRASRRGRLEARRNATLDSIFETHPDAGFVYSPDVSTNYLRGHSATTLRESPHMTEQQVLAGRQHANTGAMFRSGRAVPHDLAVEAATNMLHARAFAEAYVTALRERATTPKKGERYNIAEKIPVQIGGDKNILGKRMGEGVRLLAALEGIAERTGGQVRPEDVAKLQETAIDWTGEASPIKIDKATGEFTVNGPDVMLVDRAAIDGWVQDRQLRRSLYTDPSLPRKLAVTQRRVMLRSLPGTMIRNLAGSLAFAAVSGASPIDAALYVRERHARRAQQAGAEYTPHRGTMRHEETQRGVISGEVHGRSRDKAYARGVKILERDIRVGYPAAAWADLMGHGNRVVEDFGRAMTAIHERRQLARNLSEMKLWERVAERFGRTTAKYDDLMRQMQNGPPSDPLVRDVAREVEKWHGDILKINKYDPKLSSVIAFHKWYEHIVKQTLVTLPFKHPMRGHLIQQLGQQGDEYVKEHGILPSWLADSWIIKTIVAPAAGNRAADLIAMSIVTQGYIPWSTAGGLMRAGAEGEPVPATLSSVLLPGWNAALTAVLGDTPQHAAMQLAGEASAPRDTYGNDIELYDLATKARIFAAQAMRVSPVVNAWWPSINQSVEAMPWEQDRLRYRSARGPQMKGMDAKYAPQAVDAENGNWALRREWYGPRRADFAGTTQGSHLFDFLARAVGLTPRYTPVEGARSDFERDRNIDWAQYEAQQQRKAKTKGKEKADAIRKQRSGK